MQEQMQEREITLREYINVTIKRKWIIITVFFGAIIVAAIINLMMPRIYEISMILKPGIIEVTDKGETIYLDSTEDMKAKIEKVIFNEKITKAFNLGPQEEIADFKIVRIADPEMLKISIERQEKQVPSGIKILNRLFEQLHLAYLKMIDSEYKKIERQISNISDDIASRNNEIDRQKEAQKEKLALLEEKEKRLNILIGFLRFYTTKTLNKIRALLEESETIDDSAFRSYIGIIRQNTVYTDELRTKLDDLKSKKAGLSDEIKKLQEAVKPLAIKIEELSRKKDNIGNIKLIQEPKVSSLPITSKKRQSVILAGILGLMLGTLSAFFMEYLEKNK